MEATNKTFFETMADMQKQAVENFTNAANGMQNVFGNNSNIDSDLFKKWYDSQMAWFNNANAENKNPNQAFEFFNNWMNSQVNMAKTWFENSQSYFNNMMTNQPNADMKTAYSNMMGLYNNWMNTMQNSYSEMMKNFSNNNTKEYFAGMFNNAEMYMKAFEFWMPMMKSIQDKTFTPDMFKQMFNTTAYKEMMDKMFGMQPEWLKTMMDSNMGGLKENMGKMMDMNKSMYDNAKTAMWNNMPDMNQAFAKIMSNYNEWNTALNNAVAPVAKLIGNNNNTVNMAEMQEMATMMMNFNLKNSQMQYMMYNTGLKAMEEVSETIYTKIRNGEDMSSFTSIYSNWLNTNDKTFVKLFETEEYSKIMSEVSALQLNLKKKIETQMEKAMAHLPLINRTEMDELYKTIYELKKRVNMLEKQLDTDVTVEEAPKAQAKKSAKNAN